MVAKTPIGILTMEIFAICSYPGEVTNIAKKTQYLLGIYFVAGAKWL